MSDPDNMCQVCIKKVNVRSALARRPPTFSVNVPTSSTMLLLLILCTNPASTRQSWIIHYTVKSARRKQNRENEEIPKQAQCCAQQSARGSNCLRPLLKVHSQVPASLSSGRKKNSLVSVATAVLAHPALKAPVRAAVRWRQVHNQNNTFRGHTP